jgi:exodeoxyribonuclease VII small subunit
MKKNISFEEAISTLEEIVRKLESSNLTLDESLDSFKAAVELVKICNDKLEGAKQEVKILVEGQDGTVSDAPFVKQDEA